MQNKRAYRLALLLVVYDTVDALAVALERLAGRLGNDPDSLTTKLLTVLEREVTSTGMFDWWPVHDQTGNPWPDCMCNDARYREGHMECCPAYGRTADAPGLLDGA